MANGQGALVQHARESCLQPTDTPGQVYLRCECGLDEETVLLLVRLRDGFTFDGPISVSATCSDALYEHSVQGMHKLGTIDNATPVLLSTVKSGVPVLPGSHFYLHVYFNLDSSAPPSQTAAEALPTVLAAIEEEKRKLSHLKEPGQEEELLAHICKPLPMPYCRNLEFVCKVARLRHDALYDARDLVDGLWTSCDYLQSGLVDRLHGTHFAKRRQDLSSELASLRSQHSPTKPTRKSAAPVQQVNPSWSPREGDDVMYTDDAGNERTVNVKGVLPDGHYKICWTRQTERRRLGHRDGRPLQADEVRSLRTGYDLVYAGYDVSVLRVLLDADDVDDDGVPRLEINITRVTTKVSPCRA